MIRFKDPSVEKEFNQLPVHNKRLYKALLMLEQYLDLEIKKDLILTEIYRDPTENAKQGGIPNSPHMNWEAADLRSFIYTEEEIAKITAFLNQLTFRNGKETCVYHAVKNGAPHLHIQVAKG